MTRDCYKYDVPAILLICTLAACIWQFQLNGPVPTVTFDVFGNSDQYNYYYILLKQQFGSLLAGKLPLWNSYQLAGAPLMATGQVSIFYPINFVHVLLPVEKGMAVFAFVHFVLAGVLAYALGRALELDRIPALILATIYAFSGFIVGTHMWPNVISTVAWFPAPFAAVAWIHRGGRALGCVALAVSTAMLLLAGYVECAYFALSSLAAYALYNGVRTARKRGTRALVAEWAWIGAGVCIGSLLAAPQLVPTIDLVTHAVRGPSGLTNAQIEPTGHAQFSWPFDHPGSARARIGSVAMLLLLPGLFTEKLRQETVFFLALAVFAYLLAFGSGTPLFEIYKHLPGVRLFRVPARQFSIFCLAGATAAALGMQAILLRPASSSRSRAIECVVLTGMALWAIWVSDAVWAICGAIALMLGLYLPPRAIPAVGFAVLALAYGSLYIHAENREMQIWRPGAMRILTDQQNSTNA